MKFSKARLQKQGRNHRVRVCDVLGVEFAYKVPKGSGGDEYPVGATIPYALYGVDAGIANVLYLLNKHGYPTMTSMSGLVKDYPDSKEGSEFGYVMFWKMTKRKTDAVRNAAIACKLLCYKHTDIVDGDLRGVDVRTEGHFKDGTSYGDNWRDIRDIRALAASMAGIKTTIDVNRALIVPVAGTPNRKYITWSRNIEQLTEKYVKAHGGYIKDKETIELWKCFVTKLTGETPTVF